MELDLDNYYTVPPSSLLVLEWGVESGSSMEWVRLGMETESESGSGGGVVCIFLCSATYLCSGR